MSEVTHGAWRVASEKAMVTADFQEIIEKAKAAPMEQPRVADREQMLERMIAEMDTMRQVPGMGKQVKYWGKQKRHLQKLLKAAKAGYAEFTPNMSWTAGFISKPSVMMKGEYYLYARMMPANVLAASLKARRLGVFDVFTVHSPDEDAFIKVRGHYGIRHRFQDYMRNLDPVLIGWVNAHWVLDKDGWYEGLESKDKNMGAPVSYLIAAWDLPTDLKALPAPRQS